MRIDWIDLHQFGGLSDVRLELGSGLCAIVGDNDVGKTTIFQAISHALLTPTSLTKPKLEKKLGRYIPIGAGDHATVEMQLTVGEESWVLHKTWSPEHAVRGVRLRTPSGAEISSDSGVEETLADLLPAGAATIETVLMTYQAGLGLTFDNIAGETLHDLDDILQASVAEAGGLSIARFEEALATELSDLDGRWDFYRGAASDGREHHNPWKRGAGAIVLAHYRASRSRENHDRALAGEARLDELAQQFAVIERGLTEGEQYLATHQGAFDALGAHALLNAEEKKLELQLDQHKKLYADWGRLADEAATLAKELPPLAKSEAELGARVADSKKSRAGKELRDQLLRAEKLKVKWDEATVELEKATAVTKEELAAIEAVSDALTTARAELSSGKLALSFEAKTDQEIEVIRDLDEAEPRRVFAHKSLEIEAGGRITLEHPEWGMTVTSGSGDFEKIAARFAEAEAELGELLRAHDFVDRHAARVAQQKWAEQAGAAEGARRALVDELGELPLEELRARVEALGPATEVADSDQLVEEHVTTRGELSTKRLRVTELEEILSTWNSEHGSRDAVLENLAGFKSEQSAGEKKRAELPAPPGGVSQEVFRRAFEEQRDRREQLRNERAELKIELEVARSTLGEVSSEELAAEVQAAEHDFEKHLRRAVAIQKIQATMATLDDEGGASYDGIRAEVEALFSRLSNARYGEIQDDDEEQQAALPRAFVRSRDEVAIPVEIMSHGMRDAVALACRLAMARHFLADAEGFLMMDDPLVNLDRDRQKLASAILKEAAADKQTIVFTCHPAHAEMLGAEVTKLGED